MENGLCIYHGGCDDGFGAAWVTWKRHGDSIEYYPGVYQKDPPDVAGRTIVMVDFSYKRPVMERIVREARHLTVLDHHKTAEEDLRDLPSANVHFDMDKSGAMLAWDFFFSFQDPPDLIRYIQHPDLWRRSLPGIDEFTMALRSYPQDFAVWDALRVPALIEEGKAILRYYRTVVDAAKRTAFRRTIGGIEVPVANVPYAFASEVAGELAEGWPFAACFYETADGINFSLRSREGGADVSAVARMFGGGGHRGAAGFRVAHGHWPAASPSLREMKVS